MEFLSSNRSGVGESVLASGEVDFDDITPDELILGLNKVPAGVRSNFTYAFHPDMKAVFKTKKDNNGNVLVQLARNQRWNLDGCGCALRIL